MPLRSSIYCQGINTSTKLGRSSLRLTRKIFSTLLSASSPRNLYAVPSKHSTSFLEGLTGSITGQFCLLPETNGWVCFLDWRTSIHSVDRGYAMMSCCLARTITVSGMFLHSILCPEFSEHLIIKKYTCEMTPCRFNTVLLRGWCLCSLVSVVLYIYKRRLALDRNISMPIYSIHHWLSIDNLNWNPFKRIQIPKKAKYSRSSYLGQAH